MRPVDMGLTEPPKLKVIQMETAGDDAGEEAHARPPPVMVKSRGGRSTMPAASAMEFYCRATGPVLTPEDGTVYQIACAINIAKQILSAARKDVWDCIYPKNERGTPMYNPAGKYLVVLSLMGEQRAVTVDDRMPVVDGVCLLPRTKDKSEIWTLVLAKALLKAASLPAPPPADGAGEDAAPDGAAPGRVLPGYPDSELLSLWVTALTGWHPERIPVSGFRAWGEVRRRLALGSVFPLACGNHPQERLKYISTQSVESVPGDFKPTASGGAPPARLHEALDGASIRLHHCMKPLMEPRTSPRRRAQRAAGSAQARRSRRRRRRAR